MRVRRPFQLALLVTLLFAAGYEAIPRTIAAFRAIEQRHDLALATAAVARVRAPAGFRPTRSGCAFYPCFVSSGVGARTALATVLASLHARWQTRLCTDTHCALTGTLHGQPISVFLLRTAVGSRLEIAGP
jgi:hypothetical protein